MRDEQNRVLNPPRYCQATGKRIWRGQNEAKRAHSKAHFRIKAYRCRECCGWHVTARDKA